MITLDNAIESIDKLNETNKEKYYRSLKWFNDAFF